MRGAKRDLRPHYVSTKSKNKIARWRNTKSVQCAEGILSRQIRKIIVMAGMDFILHLALLLSLLLLLFSSGIYSVTLPHLDERQN